MPASTPDPPEEPISRRAIDLLFNALPAIGSAIGFVGFVAIIGGAIEWVRFQSVGLPANQALHALSRSELVIDGAWALFLFVSLAIVAAVATFLFRRADVGGIGYDVLLLTAAEALLVAYVVGGLSALWLLPAWAGAIALIVVTGRDLGAGPAASSVKSQLTRSAHARRLERASSRWHDAAQTTKAAHEWAGHLAQATAPQDAIAESERQLAAALSAQRQAEEEWRHVVDTLEPRHE